MKFTCDRCSKRFSSVDEPLPGRVYRIRCRCGNVIQISAPHATGPARLAAGVGLDGARAAPPAIAGSARAVAARRATPAGDAAAPVRHAAAEARAPLPATRSSARRPEPAAASPLAGHEAETFHPLATPIEALAPGPLPPRSASPDVAAAPSLETHGFPSAGARRVDRETSGVPWGVEDAGSDPAPSLEGFPSEDPFLAASRFELGGDFETTAPGIAKRPATPERDGRADVGVEAAPPAAGGDHAAAAPPHDTESPPEFPLEEAPTAGLAAPVAPEEPAAAPGASAVRAAGEGGETSVELSVSEQYRHPRAAAAARRRRRVLVVLAALAVVAGIGGAAAHVLTRGEAPPVTASLAVATSSAAPADAAPPSPGAAGRDAEERREAAARQESARQEEARQEEARRAEAERIAEAERVAEAERRAEAERLAESERAAAEREAAAERKAAAEREAEADRRAAAERAARADKQVAAALRRPAKPDPAVSVEAPRAGETESPPPAPGVLAETQRRREDAPAPKPDPLPEGLEPSQLQTVIRANRAALEDCAAGALADPATAVYAGNKVTFIILVGPDGRVEAALEDPALDESPFGACLRRAASRMTFPAFRGEPVGARIPLRIGAAP